MRRRRASGSPDGAFPVTIEHKFGSTEIPEEPERVVALGYQEQDPILALGVTPIAVRYWFGDESDVIFPWAEDEAGGADPEILNMPDAINFERIAALEPDLILGVYSGMTARDYALLSQIAPTVAQTDEYIDYGTPWQVHTVTVGKAEGRAVFVEEPVLAGALALISVLRLPYAVDRWVPMLAAAVDGDPTTEVP